MSERREPPVESRRAAEFTRELLERARAWIPAWSTQDEPGDFGAALLAIAGRFSGEVAERLDRAGEKMSRGLLDWLAVRGLAARPARMPVALKLAASAQNAVLARAPVRMQVDVDGASVVFETESDVRLVPGTLDRLVAIDAAADAYYLPPPGLGSLEPVQPLPVRWLSKSFAAANATTLQLDPALGLLPGIQIEILGEQYRVVAIADDLVTVEPPISAAEGVEQGTQAIRIEAFAPYQPGRRNEQRHALYLGHDDLLNLDAPATIDVIGAQSLAEVQWQYWGKRDGDEQPSWQDLQAVGATADGMRLRKQAQGAIEPVKVGALQSRWIRAVSAQATGALPLLSADEIALKVNADAAALSCPLSTQDQALASPEMEAFANTTPLVLGTLFYPLGREPRQFDAFYLGSAEAFSKPHARVAMCFEMADPTAFSFAVLRGGWLKNRILASVGGDRALHLFYTDGSSGRIVRWPNRVFLQPKATGAGSGGTPVQLDPAPKWRLPAWSDSIFDFSIAAAAGDAIWVWKESVLNQAASGWTQWSSLPPLAAPAPIAGLVFVDGTPAQRMYALREGQLFFWEPVAAPTWTPLALQDSVTNAPLSMLSIAPIRDWATQGVIGLVGVADDNFVYRIAPSGSCSLLDNTLVDAETIPAALSVGGTLHVVAAASADALVVVSPVASPPESMGAGAELLGGSLEMAASATGKVFALAPARIDGSTRLITWGALDDLPSAELLGSEVPAATGAFKGAPTALDRFVVAPGVQGDALVASWDPAALISGEGLRGAGVVLPASFPALAIGDRVAVPSTTPPRMARVTGVDPLPGDETFYLASDAAIATSVGSEPVLAFRTSQAAAALAGMYLGGNRLRLAAGDVQLGQGDLLLMDDGPGTDPRLFRVDDVDDTVTPWEVELLPPAAGLAANTAVSYWRSEQAGGHLAPALTLTSNNNWDPAILATAPMILPTGVPREQRGKMFRGAGNHPELIVFASTWITAPTNGRYLINAALGAWRRELGDSSANPELAWEYWNGKSWWTLGVTQDATSNLKSTGLVAFEVPANLAQTEVAGRQNHWIRARLIGGDYGREQVKVKVKDLGNGETEQTVERSQGDVQAPSVVSLRMRYSVADAVRPRFLLSEDSGSLRDQSDANATPGARVEAFVPMSLMLQRLQGGAAATAASADGCGCDPCQAAASNGKAETAKATGADARALFLGLDARLSGAPVNVLLVVDHEQDHEGFAPLAVDVLDGDHFQPLVVQDTTRALGESGLLSLAFATEPKPASLFGQTRTWLRLRPSRSDPAGEWRPQLRGAYLNAVWARAAETLSREPLGSSDGRPLLTLRVSRPPLLHGSLELRVRESLGTEELDALRQGDPDRVLSEVVDLPGHWVRWEATADTADHGPDERVYALDESLGEIRFGDGRHGMIPPIGRDAVVAFRYERTEPPPPGQDDAPANRVRARDALNLVTPVESVEAAFAADGAAGGAPPETDQRVLRFGYARLRHRDRAVTAEDFQDIALQSSIEVAQAMCSLRAGRLRLVVVMRDGGGPNAAQARELRQRLLEASAPGLAAPGALRIDGPRVRNLRVGLRLAVASLDEAGAVAQAARLAVQRLFDPVLGGNDGGGWPLGATPRDDDIAARLLDLPGLESIVDIVLESIDGNGVATPWNASLRADELAVLDEDGVRIHFEPVEVAW
ncbi:MAG: hypothetical protein ABWY31_02065 [Pseudoxanthomonas sp.]